MNCLSSSLFCYSSPRIVRAKLSRGKSPATDLYCNQIEALVGTFGLKINCVFCVVRRQMALWTVSAWPSPAPSTVGVPCWQWAAMTVALSFGTSSHGALLKLSAHTSTLSALYGKTHYTLLLGVCASLPGSCPILCTKTLRHPSFTCPHWRDLNVPTKFKNAICLCVCSWSRDGHKLVSASTDNIVSQWDVLTGDCDQRFRFPSPILKLQCHPRDMWVTW